MIVDDNIKPDRPRRYSEEKARMDKLIKVMLIMVGSAIFLSILYLILF